MIVNNDYFIEQLKINKKWACGHDVENGWQTRQHPTRPQKTIKLAVLRYVGFCLAEWDTPKEAIKNIVDENVIYTYVNVKDLEKFIDAFIDACITRAAENDKYYPVLMIAHNHNYELHAYQHNSNLYKKSLKYKLLNRSKNDTLSMTIEDDKKDLIIFRDSMLLYDEKRSLAEITEAAPKNIKKLVNVYNYDMEIMSEDQLPPSNIEIKYNYVDCLGALWAYFNKFLQYDEIIPHTDISVLTAATNCFQPKLLPVTLISLNKMLITYKALSNVLNNENDIYIKSLISLKKNYNKRGRIAYKMGKYKNEHNPAELVAINKLIIKNSKKISTFINPPTVDAYKFIRKAAGGGIITNNILYYREMCENVKTFDQVSAYPFATTCHLYPSGNFKDLEAWEAITFIYKAHAYAEEMQSNPENLIYKTLRVPGLASTDVTNSCTLELEIDNISLKNSIPIMPLSKVKGKNITSALGKVIMCENVILHCTFEDLIIYMAFYNIDGIKFVKGIKYSMREMPTFYAERFRVSYIEKDNLKQIKKIIEQSEIATTDAPQLAQYHDFICINGLNKNAEHWQQLYDFFDDKYEKAKKRLNANYGIIYMDINRNKYIVANGAPTYEKDEYISDKGIAYLLGMYIAQWGRFAIANAIQYAQNQNAPVIYVHTDCIKCITDNTNLMQPFNGFVEKIKYYKPRLMGAGLYEHKEKEEYYCCMPLGNGKLIGLTSKKHELIETYTGLRITDIFKAYKGKALKKEELKNMCNMVITGVGMEQAKIKFTTMLYDVSGFEIMEHVTCFGALTEMQSSAFELEKTLAERELETIEVLKEIAKNGKNKQ